MDDALRKREDGHVQGGKVVRKVWLPTQRQKENFLRLVANAVRDFKRQRDANGLSYAQKSMILTGMAQNYNDILEDSQLTPGSQRMLMKHRDWFEGRVATESVAEE